jgi:hypothetical protein
VLDCERLPFCEPNELAYTSRCFQRRNTVAYRANDYDANRALGFFGDLANEVRAMSCSYALRGLVLGIEAEV